MAVSGSMLAMVVTPLMDASSEFSRDVRDYDSSLTGTKDDEGEQWTGL